MEIKFTSLFHVDRVSGLVRNIPITDDTEEIKKYVDDLVFELSNNSNRRRQFKFTGPTEIRNSLDKIIEDGSQDVCESNANRLLKIENELQKRMGQLKLEIQKGSLFHAHVNKDNVDKIIICKADHDEFLDEVDFKIHIGLPWKKKVFKAVIISFIDLKIESVFVYDSNPTFAKYWWERYLELIPEHSDAYNTETSLDMIFKKVINPLKRGYPEDYLTLRNSTIGLFRTKVDFDLEDYIKYIEDYSPQYEKFPKEKTITKLKELPEKSDFDSHFTISKEHISKRLISQKIKLTDSIDIEIKDYVKELDQVITTGKDENGQRYIRIMTDTGYQFFKEKGKKDDTTDN